MFNFFWKWLGYHMCEEFTQWQVEKEEWVKTIIVNNIPVMEMPYVEKIQTRQCTICGKTQRNKII
jgi:hypothetical protein